MTFLNPTALSIGHLRHYKRELGAMQNQRISREVRQWYLERREYVATVIAFARDCYQSVGSHKKGGPKHGLAWGHADHVLATCKTQHEAIEWAKKNGHTACSRPALERQEEGRSLAAA